MAGFWKAPRELARLRGRGDLSARAYELLHFLGECGADRAGGIQVSDGYPIAVLGASKSTIRRAFRDLRALGLIEYESHPGVAAFEVRTTASLAALCEQPWSQPRPLMTNPVTSPLTKVGEQSAKRDQGSAARKAAPTEVKQGALSADVTKVEKGPETETEIENHPTGGEITPSAADRGLLVHELVAEYVTRYQERNEERPPRTIIALVGRKLGEMLAEGVSIPTASKAIDRMLDRRLDPTMLPRLAADVAGPPAVLNAEQVVDALIRDEERRPPIVAGTEPLPEPEPVLDTGPCADCRRETEGRLAYGQLHLCARCFGHRQRVAGELEPSPAENEGGD